MRLFKKKTPPVPAASTSADLLIEAKLLAQKETVSRSEAHRIMRLAQQSGRLEILEMLRETIYEPLIESPKQMTAQELRDFNMGKFTD